jgi:hypothetical protein
VEAGRAAGADFVTVPTLIGEGGTFRLAMRKLGVNNGRVEAVAIDAFQGDLNTVFTRLPYATAKVAPPKSNKPPFKTVIGWMSPPSPKKPAAEAQASAAPKALRPSEVPAEKLAAADAAMRSAVASTAPSAAEAKEPVQAGSITSVDTQWSFCEVSCKGALPAPGDQLTAVSATDRSKMVTLTVSRIEGSRAIADFHRSDPRAALLRSGDLVYRWAVVKK